MVHEYRARHRAPKRDPRAYLIVRGQARHSIQVTKVAP
jgi:hypothetical protein